MLYFIACLLPDEIAADIRHFQQTAAQRFHSRRALRNPVHITLIPPFRFPNTKNKNAKPEILLQRLKTFFQKNKTLHLYTKIHLQINGFAAFPPRVIFAEVLPNEHLTKLQASLQKATSDLTGLPSTVSKRPFHPHITIAYRDLRENVFPSALRYFQAQPYQAEFDLKHVSLLIHQNKKWQVLKNFQLFS